MRIMLGFMKGLRTLALPWQVWVGGLAGLNMLVPFFFLDRIEAIAVLAAIVIAALLQMLIFAQKGFVKLLGLGHIVPWVPLLSWLATRLPTPWTESAFGVWLGVLLAANGLSLLIDIADVVRYFRGETTPTYRLERTHTAA